jgi:hypothetical protein
MSAKKRGRPRGERPPKRTVCLRLDVDLHDQLTRAAWWERTTLTALIEKAVAGPLRQAQKRHNHGKPFEPLPHEQEEGP